MRERVRRVQLSSSNNIRSRAIGNGHASLNSHSKGQHHVYNLPQACPTD